MRRNVRKISYYWKEGENCYSLRVKLPRRCSDTWGEFEVREEKCVVGGALGLLRGGVIYMSLGKCCTDQGAVWGGGRGGQAYKAAARQASSYAF